MPPLKNPKHEQFCHNLVKEPTQTKAYLATTPNVTEASARNNASRLMANASIKDRFFEILKGSGIDLPHITSRFRRWLNDDSAPVQSWDAVKTGLKIYGVIDADEKNSIGIQNVTINIATLNDSASNNNLAVNNIATLASPTLPTVSS